MIARGILAALLLATAATAVAQKPPQRLSPNPSAIVAAEIAFARLAQEKGQWTAFRETAARDAVMFVPHQVPAQDWLRKQANPPAAVRWQAHRIFMSCDGMAGVSTGAWQRPDGSHGYFTTIWRREKKGWKWVLDHGDTLATPREPGEMIAGSIARCPGRGPGQGPTAAMPSAAPPVLSAPGTGQSPDGSLRWSWTVGADASRRLQVFLRNGDEEQLVLSDEVAVPK